MSQPLLPDPPLAAPALAAYRAGRQALAAGDRATAVRELNVALQQGEHPDVLQALAELAGDSGDMAAAEQYLRRALRIRDAAQLKLQLAIAIYRQQRHAEALPLFEAAIPHVKIEPPVANAYAQALETAGRRAQAAAIRQQVFAQAPTPSHALQWAALLERSGEHERLAALLPDLLARFPRDPELLTFAANHALGCGDYPRGFALLRACAELAGGDPRLAGCPPWDGRPFAGTLLVSMEPHIGEEILVSSLLVPLAACGQPAVVEVDARLLPLFRRAWPTLEFVARGSDALAARRRQGDDCRRVAAIDLAQLFDRRFRLPGTPAWLQPPPELCARKRDEYARRWPGCRRVGISWRSARQTVGGERKSVPLAALTQTLSLPDTAFVDLQYGDYRGDVDALPSSSGAPWRDPEIDPLHDLDALAAQLCALDVFVTVSNTTAHLAGALGVPTIVLLPQSYPVFWHWGYRGTQSTWYASATLLRNPEEQGHAQLDGLLTAMLRGPSV